MVFGHSIDPHGLGILTERTRWLLAAGVRMGTINGDTGRQYGAARSVNVQDWLDTFR